jgi:hypothetical protein
MRDGYFRFVEVFQYGFIAGGDKRRASAARLGKSFFDSGDRELNFITVAKPFFVGIQFEDGGGGEKPAGQKKDEGERERALGIQQKCHEALREGAGTYKRKSSSWNCLVSLAEAGPEPRGVVGAWITC